ncbi:SDR family oxidoreductase [Streptomyces sp. NPDC059649]|uniref:SDR family oxidoreductase n=1 Tax=Streptomyces sp. NPDC059649 TaxID=3346895 RepID=UPI0036A62996
MAVRLSGFDGKVTVVTGAAGGIGASVCRALAACGAVVAAVDDDVAGLGRLVAERDGDCRRKVVAYPGDVAVDRSAREILPRVEREWGPVDGLVNVAGILRAGSALSCTAEDWSSSMAVNATGVFLWSKAVAARMAARGTGAIVTVASNAIGVPRMGMSAYTASKAAAAAYTLGLGLEVAPRGVRCNVVCPGTTETAMLAQLGPDAAAAAVRGDPAAYRVGIPNGRVARPQDVADAVVFLLSDQARHITLHSLYVDGGAALRG